MAEQDWKKRLGVVYSTNPDFQYRTEETPEEETLPPGRQRLIVRIDRRPQGGQAGDARGRVRRHAPTISRRSPRTLKTKCGVGGSAKDGEITIQGDLRDKVTALLREMGYNASRGN